MTLSDSAASKVPGYAENAIGSGLVAVTAGGGDFTRHGWLAAARPAGSVSDQGAD
jgi:hypothetical protein